MYPHTANCYWWDERDRLVCTARCRMTHPRTWRVRLLYHVNTAATGIVPTSRFWGVFRRTRAYGGYVLVAEAATFADALAHVRVLKPADHVSP